MPDRSPIGPAPADAPATDAAPEIATASAAAVARAAEILRAGALVGFPTETVYGLGADATNDRAVAAIFAAKRRPRFNPLIIHVADAAAADAIVCLDERAGRLAEALWPGPLTLVLPRRPDAGVSLLVSAGLDTIAVRVPAHPVARRLIEALGRPIAAPSANRSGAVSATTPRHVAESLGSRVRLVLAAGRSPIGIESTVLDLTGERPILLRPGGTTLEEIEAVIGPVDRTGGKAPAHAPRSPGQLASHYAPALPVRLEAHSADAGEALLAFGPDAFVSGGRARLNLSALGDLTEAAANLFVMLRALDQPAFTGIAVMPIPEHGLGLAINDRLRRAAAPRDAAPADDNRPPHP